MREFTLELPAFEKEPVKRQIAVVGEERSAIVKGDPLSERMLPSYLRNNYHSHRGSRQ